MLHEKYLVSAPSSPKRHAQTVGFSVSGCSCPPRTYTGVPSVPFVGYVSCTYRLYDALK
jgi:hypothetical protein